MINNHAVPVVTGGQANLYARLTTWYVPHAAGYAVAALVWGRVNVNAQRRAHGFDTDDGELVFLKLFIAAQAVFLFMLVTNQFRGVPP